MPLPCFLQMSVNYSRSERPATYRSYSSRQGYSDFPGRNPRYLGFPHVWLLAPPDIDVQAVELFPYLSTLAKPPTRCLLRAFFAFPTGSVSP
jgi:hypothetical protein